MPSDFASTTEIAEGGDDVEGDNRSGDGKDDFVEDDDDGVDDDDDDGDGGDDDDNDDDDATFLMEGCFAREE